MHKIVSDKKKKTLVATISGNIGIEQANTMLADFKNSIEGINAKETTLIISPENISANIFVLPILQSFIQLIGQLNFNRIILIDSDKYAGMIKQSLSSYSVASRINYANSLGEALSKI
ncbi:MAG: hypothetical protein K0Q99_2243 [Clostridia bacterium]|nr:hypothetical protein [Clostridia bacterium]